MHSSVRNAIRPAAVAGRFYPARAELLRDEVDGRLRAASATPAAREGPAGRLKMLLVPHAGHVYSGASAAAAYARLAADAVPVRRVVLIGPTHRVLIRGIAIPESSAFATPLGRVPLDADALADIAAAPQVVRSEHAHAQEHALEVQLPFLQRVLGDFTLVPLAVGQVTPEAVAEVLERLWGGDETLIVISSDLSHYLPYAQAQQRDHATVQRVLQLDPALAHDEACGATPLAAALLVARREGLKARLLDLRNSGDTAGDRLRVVGYAAVAFEAGVGPRADVQSEDEVASLDWSSDPATAQAQADDDGDATLGAALMAHARAAIGARLGLATADAPAHPALGEPGASFVTLRHRGALRGCIGTLEASRALRDDVRAHAEAAAFDDRRFAPLAPEEFAELEVEVSLLGATERVFARSEDDAQQALRPGLDGVILEWRGRRATFLPQVWQQLPTAREFLRALRGKAGLPGDFWADDLVLSRYRVRKFVQTPAGEPP